MSTSEERGRIAKEHGLALEQLKDLAKIMHEKAYSNAAIAHILRLSESTVRTMLLEPVEPEINWGYNCLTPGVHHGRPEALWNLPLFQAVHMFDQETLKDLVVYRIYTDALIYVHRGAEPRPNEEWAGKIKEEAEKRYSNALQHKIGEIVNYYKSSTFQNDVKDVVKRVKDNRLNPYYEPLHSHDTINMLCRIIGVSSNRAVG